jgi:hypothetical protein
MKLTIKLVVILASLVFLLIPDLYAEGKEFKLTTYYPAPYGEYKQLRATGSNTSDNEVALEARGSMGEGLTVTNANRMGVGTKSPQAKLDVRGDMRVSSQLRSVPANGTVSTAQNVINWDNGNIIIANPTQANLTFQNMQEGGAYTLVITSAPSRTYTFSQSMPDPISASSFKFAPTNSATTANKTTVYTFIRAGNIVYVSWIKDF